ncbi:Mitochondrial transcription termination factor family protein [Forsythia ovata]|uniref:Mitochondrial transcription termination factor family protein n=1 Tax=Forsythia ovata TaxID=205694 RepID=A0ABD1U536_9LAMI
MLGKSLASPLLAFYSTVDICSFPYSGSAATNNLPISVNLSNYVALDVSGEPRITSFASRRWELHSTAEIQDAVFSDEDKKTWESCTQALAAFGFTNEAAEKTLGKAFGQIHSPYWGEERKKEVPRIEVVNEILNYLKGLGLKDDDIGKFLKKFPEVLGCNLENELKSNVQILENQWGIKGKSLKNLLLRNPRALGYNVDCKGDCMAQCTRCWARHVCNPNLYYASQFCTQFMEAKTKP